jgi:threonylcarbamoyladenosine tRNA methylthiotransferase MtaB
MSIRFYLESLGCKLNQCERDMLAQQVVAAGHTMVWTPELADVCVVNTCAVTHVAARKSRQRMRQLRRANPNARLVVTGCSTGLADDGLLADLVVTNERKERLVSLVLASWDAGDQASPEVSQCQRAAFRRTRPLVKIQDGCDNACTYCVVRLLRGKQHSRPRSEILAQVAALVQQGYHELVLTGVHVGAYGRDTGDDLGSLVRAILAESPPDRLRLSSIEPWDLKPDFLSLWQDPHLCRHLHLPLQSGCDATLQRMNRRYTVAQFADLVAGARTAIPDLAVTTDVIVGFPGETDDEFAVSAGFVERVGFSRIHVFPYSERPGTPAATMSGQVDARVRQERARQIAEIGRRSGRAFRDALIGQRALVLWESRLGGGRWSGLTDHYVRVFARSEAELANTLCPARLTRHEAGGLWGETDQSR